MSRRISRALVLADAEDGAEIRCARCGHALAPGGSPWKPAAAMREVPMNGVGGQAYTSGAQVVLRRFSCPGCGSLLDTETALPGDPFLEDILEI
jgi:acetone carboxylase gamma subunit